MHSDRAPAMLISTNGFMRGSSTLLRPGTMPHKLHTQTQTQNTRNHISAQEHWEESRASTQCNNIKTVTNIIVIEKSVSPWTLSVCFWKESFRDRKHPHLHFQLPVSNRLRSTISFCTKLHKSNRKSSHLNRAHRLLCSLDKLPFVFVSRIRPLTPSHRCNRR